MFGRMTESGRGSTDRLNPDEQNNVFIIPEAATATIPASECEAKLGLNPTSYDVWVKCEFPLLFLWQFISH
jgi:hypothetical protein